MQAAATPLAGGTALEVLERLAVPSGGTMLVLGARGGVGGFLLQLASHAGLKVIAVGGRTSHDHMRELGAAARIDYMTEDVAARAAMIAGGQVDTIADLVGGDHLTDPWGCSHATDRRRRSRRRIWISTSCSIGTSPSTAC